MIKILSPSQIKEWDEFSIKEKNIDSIDLMETASKACINWIKAHFSTKEKFKILCGNGNNGGDGLAIGRLLYAENYDIEIIVISYSEKRSSDFEINYKRANELNMKISEANSADEILIYKDEIIIDAIIGSGLNKSIKGLLRQSIEKINGHANLKISIDVPSGLNTALSEETYLTTCLTADYTLTFQTPKLSFLFPEANICTGEIVVLDIGLSEEFNLNAESEHYWVTSKFIKQKIKTRKKFDHKGSFGHALIAAGSFGKIGAAVLASKACLRSGVGLLTVCIPKSGNDILQIAVPEAMALTLEEYDKYLNQFPDIEKYSAIGIGPGIGTEPITKTAVKKFLSQPNLPSLIIDADGLNILAQILKEEVLFKIPEKAILTPHLKEFDRLAGDSANNIERYKKQLAFSKTHGVFVLLKGAFTRITTPDGKVYFNSTGNPGMATGGSGDVLTGIITGLRAQGYTELDSCIIGAYLHGLSGDLAAQEKSQQAMIAGDIINMIGEAFKSCLASGSYKFYN